MSIIEREPFSVIPTQPSGIPQQSPRDMTPGSMELPKGEKRVVLPSPGPSQDMRGATKTLFSPAVTPTIEKDSGKISPTPDSVLESTKKVEEVVSPVLGDAPSAISPRDVSPIPERTVVAAAAAPPVPKFDPKEIASMLIAQGVPQDVAMRVADGFNTGWKDFVRKTDAGWQQIHGIRGLKVYEDPWTKSLCAEYGLETLSEGSSKRLKNLVRFSNDGIDINCARFTTKKTDEFGHPLPIGEKEMARREVFQPDISWELEKREQLGVAGKGKPVDFLLAIVPIRYVNARGDVKTRYLTQKCGGNLQHFFVSKSTGARRPQTSKMTRAGLRCCRDALYALKILHERGMVHRDIKLGNILFLKDEKQRFHGRLADLGFCARMPDPKTGDKGDPFRHSGTPTNTAPEIFFGVAQENNPSMDMYSYGITLLEVVHPFECEMLQDAQCQLLEGSGSSENYIQTLELTQKKLLMSGDPLDDLISRLIDIHPGKRPSSAQALSELSSYLQLRKHRPSKP